MTMHSKKTDDTAAAKVKLLILDVDGVMTEGRIVYDSLGREIKTFHARDGMGIKLWQGQGYQFAIISGRASLAVTARANELGITNVYQGCRRKGEVLAKLLNRLKLKKDEVAVLVDDLPDLPLVRGVGYPIAVADAAIEVRNEAKYVTQTPGGCGAVREAVEHLLQSKGEWVDVMTRFEI